MDRLAREALARSYDAGDAATGGVNAPKPKAEEELAAAAGFAGEVRGLDAATPEEMFKPRSARMIGDEWLIFDYSRIERRDGFS